MVYNEKYNRSAFECTYDIILYTKDKALQEEKIVELDTCISNANEKNDEYFNPSVNSFATYHLYTVRDKKLYKKLCKIKNFVCFQYKSIGYVHYSVYWLQVFLLCNILA